MEVAAANVVWGDFSSPTLRYDSTTVVEAVAANEVWGDGIDGCAPTLCYNDNDDVHGYEPPREVSAIDESQWMGPIQIDSSDEDTITDGVGTRTLALAYRHVERHRPNHQHQVHKRRRGRRNY